MSEYPKYQYSEFIGEGQYVVRTDDSQEFAGMVKAVQAKRTVSGSTSIKAKLPYMWEGDNCPVCNRGNLVKTVKESKAGEKYNALICDQPSCSGKAYLSKYPKQVSVNEEPPLTNEDIPF